MLKRFTKTGIVSSLSTLAFLPTIALAQLSNADDKLGEIGTKLSDTPSDLPIFIGNIINVFLSLLGVIFVLYTVYAGWLWMSDQGEGKKAQKAKDMLRQAVVGMVIIIAAYAISNFVINQLITAAKG